MMRACNMAHTRVRDCMHVHTQVDLEKVNLDVIKPWITARITELLGIEDDVIIDFVFNMLENNRVHFVLCSNIQL